MPQTLLINKPFKGKIRMQKAVTAYKDHDTELEGFVAYPFQRQTTCCDSLSQLERTRSFHL
jgi:hypothetical protein